MALQQIKERGALPMIDRGDIRQAIDRCSNIWASLPGRWLLVSSEHKFRQLITVKKRWNGQKMMYEQSHRVISALVICVSITCRGINVRDAFVPTKPARQNMKNLSWRT